MQISSIRIKKIFNDDSLIGIASIELDNCLVIHDIQLVQLKDGRRIISFPSKKIKKYEYDKDNNVYDNYVYSDIVHPSNKEFRDYIQSELYKIFDKEDSEVEK